VGYRGCFFSDAFLWDAHFACDSNYTSTSSATVIRPWGTTPFQVLKSAFSSFANLRARVALIVVSSLCAPFGTQLVQGVSESDTVAETIRSSPPGEVVTPSDLVGQGWLASCSFYFTSCVSAAGNRLGAASWNGDGAQHSPRRKDSTVYLPYLTLYNTTVPFPLCHR